MSKPHFVYLRSTNGQIMAINPRHVEMVAPSDSAYENESTIFMKSGRQFEIWAPFDHVLKAVTSNTLIPSFRAA